MSHAADIACGKHRAFAYKRGGVTLIGELKPAFSVQWNRIRDEISAAHVVVGVAECCDLLGDLECGTMELHIQRNDTTVWQGPITRLEYENDKVEIYAEDMLWVAKRTALSEGYNYAYPNIAYVTAAMEWLLNNMTYAKYSDPWNMLSHLYEVHHAGGPKTSKAVAAWSVTTWEDFDKYGEDHGVDYTVINRDIYYWDIHYAWAVLPKLEAIHLAEWPRIVEYGNELATRVIVTDNNGYAGLGQGTTEMLDHYGRVDVIVSQAQSSSADAPASDEPPTSQELAEMAATAQRMVEARHPTPTSILIPANSTLMPASPWHIEDLIPGAWFDVEVTNLCRQMVETHRLQEVVVTETPTEGEQIKISTISAPQSRIDPP